MKKHYRIAVVGATGAVGQEMLRILDSRDFPIEEIRCFASPNSAGKSLFLEEKKFPYRHLTTLPLKTLILFYLAQAKKFL